MTNATSTSSRYAVPGGPKDIRPAWLNILRRLQSVSKSKGVSVVTIRIIVDEEGEPLHWLTPRVEQVEPAASANEFLERFLGIRD